MKVVVHPADEGGCGHYRLIFPARVLVAAGEPVTISTASYSCVWQPSPFGDRIVDLAEGVDADVVVFQRPMHRNRVELIAALQKRGHAVVVEIDDDFHALHRRNPCWEQTHPLRDRDHNRDWLIRACERADLVTCTTPAIAERYAPHGRVVILPNLVPAWYLDVDRPDPGEQLTVGWTGSVHTHPGDLEVTRGGVAGALDEAVLDVVDTAFSVVGTGDGVQRALQLRDAPHAHGWLPIGDYPRAVATFDVGIVPLQLNAFNEAKSNLKMLEMAALGVPVVASPTKENQRLFHAGVGFLAWNTDDWRILVRSLLELDTIRSGLADRGRSAVVGMTYEVQAWRWLEAWAIALSHHRRKVAA